MSTWHSRVLICIFDPGKPERKLVSHGRSGTLTPNHPQPTHIAHHGANSGGYGASSNLHSMTNYPHAVKWVAEMDEGELQALLDSFPSAGAGKQDDLVTAVEARLAELKEMRI